MTDKLCTVCYQEIHPKAQKCPHCLSWQSKWLTDMANPKTAFLYFIGLIALTVLFLFTIDGVKDYLIDKGSDTESSVSHNVMKILDTEANYYICNDGSKCLVITGHIDNPSNIMWYNIYFHVEYFNNKGDLIDNHSEKEAELIIPANSTTSFKLGGRVYKEENEYASHKVTIRYASGS